MYSYTTRVRYSEITENRKVSLLSIINYFQDCCSFESEDKGVGLDWFKEHHSVWMLTGWQIKVDRYPRYCENIKVTTWACGFKFFVGKRNFTIENADTGELLVYAYSDWAYMNTESGYPEKNVPQKELDAYGMAEPLDKDFATGKIIIQDIDQMSAGEMIKVTKQYIDTNHHVNNEQYIAIAVSALSDDLIKRLEKLRSFRAEYKKQSVLGDELYPFVLVKENSGEENLLEVNVILKDKDGNTRLITEFTL